MSQCAGSDQLPEPPIQWATMAAGAMRDSGGLAEGETSCGRRSKAPSGETAFRAGNMNPMEPVADVATAPGKGTQYAVQNAITFLGFGVELNETDSALCVSGCECAQQKIAVLFAGFLRALGAVSSA